MRKSIEYYNLLISGHVSESLLFSGLLFCCMFDKNAVRREADFKQIFKALLNKPKAGGVYVDIADELLSYSKNRSRRQNGFSIAQFVEDNKGVYARSTVYKVSGILKRMGMLEYSGVTGLWRVSFEFGNAGKRIYRWWSEFIQESEAPQEKIEPESYNPDEQ